MKVLFVSSECFPLVKTGGLADVAGALPLALSDIDIDMMFTTPPEKMWELSIRRLGADPGALHTSRGVH